MLSVWRSLETVHRDPLAVMDSKSLFEKKGVTPYVPMERTYRDRPGFAKAYKSENLFPLAPETDDRYTWYYISEQTPEELYTIKLFDSEAHKEGSEVVEFAAHSAFSLPNQEKEDLRRSVEIRFLVVW